MFTELRSPEAEVLAWAEAELARQAAAAADSAGVQHQAGPVERRPAGTFDPGLVALAGQEAVAMGHALRHLDTVAGHDAISLAALCPSVMLVVPSVGGVCHNPAEFTHPEDIALGAALLARTVALLCRDGVPA